MMIPTQERIRQLKLDVLNDAGSNSQFLAIRSLALLAFRGSDEAREFFDEHLNGDDKNT